MRRDRKPRCVACDEKEVVQQQGLFDANCESRKVVDVRRLLRDVRYGVVPHVFPIARDYAARGE
eukprot:11195454-Lingulodinium_polyedra.AAC.1